MDNHNNINRVSDQKRNRQLERESNLLKDELCTMKHLIHLLDNIKRVSRDCINHLHLMVDAVAADDKPAVDQLKDDVEELEDELREWEKKYHVMNSMNETRATNNRNDSKRTSGDSPYKYQMLNHSKSSNSDEHHLNGSVDQLEKSNDRSSNPSIIPQELCEISMETYENDQMIHNSNHLLTDNISLSNNVSPPPISISSVSDSSDNQAANSHHDSLHNYSLMQKYGSSSAGQFNCEFPGCNFRTNIKQRLVMHKRLHAGELLFSCDVPGCDYQSNYKGNIKIHKKHKHKIGDDSSASTHNVSLNTTIATPTSQTLESEGLVVMNKSDQNISLVPNANHHDALANDHLSAVNNMFPRRRRRRNRFRLTMIRGNVNNDCSIFICDVKGCKYKTKWKQCLTAHQLLHAGVKPYKCDYPGCNYSTNFKGNVNVHKRVHRTSGTDEVFKCQALGCDFTTPWKNSFNLHQRNHLEQQNGAELSNDAGDGDGASDDYSNLDLIDNPNYQFNQVEDVEEDVDQDDDDDMGNNDLLMNDNLQDQSTSDSHSQQNSHHSTSMKLPIQQIQFGTSNRNNLQFDSQLIIKSEYS